MPTNIRPFSCREMLADWGKAEIPTPRFDSWHEVSTLRSWIQSGATLTNHELARLIFPVVAVRWWMLEWVLTNNTDWYLADLTRDELAAVRSDIYWESAKTLGELSKSRPDVSVKSFDQKLIRGRPVIVGPTATGKFMMIEGAHRSAEILRLGGRQQASTVEVIIGVCPAVTAWPRWRQFSEDGQ